MKKIRKRRLQQGLAFLPALFLMSKILCIGRGPGILQGLFKKEEKDSLKLSLKPKLFIPFKNSFLKQFLFSLSKLQNPSFKSDFFPQIFRSVSSKEPLFVFCLGLVCTGGCLLPSLFPSPSEIHQRSQAEQNESSQREAGRSRFTIKDKTCSENSECPDICKKVFKRRAERDECEDRSVSEVKEFERIFDFFKGKDLPSNSNAEYFGNLSRIEEEGFNEFISIIENPENFFNQENIYNEPTFRNWIAENPPIAEIFRDRDDDFKVFKEIFGMTCTNVKSSLNDPGYVERKLDSDENPGDTEKPPNEVAVSAGNRDFLQWIHDYLRNEGHTPPNPRDLIDSNTLSPIWCS